MSLLWCWYRYLLVVDNFTAQYWLHPVHTSWLSTVPWFHWLVIYSYDVTPDTLNYFMILSPSRTYSPYCLSEVGQPLSWPAQNHSNVGDTVALLAGHQTCNLQVVGSSADSAPLHSGVGQATYTYLLLSPNSIPWYRPVGVISLAGKLRTGLLESNGSLPPGLWLMSPAGCWVWDHLSASVTKQYNLVLAKGRWSLWLGK